MKAATAPAPFLFSIDLEEFYPAEAGVDPRSSPLPELVDRYLEILDRHGGRATFFVVGEVARKFPAALRRIAAAGHELGCHGDRHQTLDRFDPQGLAQDLRANREAVEAAAGVRVAGFRAPLLSLVERTEWAHRVLADEGFSYSSSVLPAASPLYGWPGFGYAPQQRAGIWEIPVTVAPLPGLGTLPLFCGTYFRTLPWLLVRGRLAARDVRTPLVSYFHPYDIDARQPWVMHAGVRGSRMMNLLLFVRRRSLPARLGRLLQACPASRTCRDYCERDLAVA